MIGGTYGCPPGANMRAFLAGSFANHAFPSNRISLFLKKMNSHNQHLEPLNPKLQTPNPKIPNPRSMIGGTYGCPPGANERAFLAGSFTGWAITEVAVFQVRSVSYERGTPVQ